MKEDKFFVILNLTKECNGKLNKKLFKAIIDQASKLNKNVYAVLVPAIKKTELMDWIAVNNKDLSLEVQEEIWKQAKVINNPCIPPILFDGDIDKPYCYALLVNDLKQYKDLPYPTWQDLKENKWNEVLITIDIGII